MNTSFLRVFVSWFHFVWNTKDLFSNSTQTVCRAGPGQADVWALRSLERPNPTHSSCQEKEDPCPGCSAEASGKRGGSAAPRPRPAARHTCGHSVGAGETGVAGNLTRGTQQLQEHW